MENIMQFVSENMYIVVAALYIIGVFIKAIPKIPNWIIPFVLAAVGIVFGVWMIGGAQGILQGVLCAGGAVLVNQAYKQVKENVGGKEE